MIKRLAVLLASLAIAAILWAATSTEPVTSLTETSGDWRDSASSTPSISAVDGTNDTWPSTWGSDFICDQLTSGEPYTLRFDFDTPANSPSSTTNAQAIRIAYVKGKSICTILANKDNPTFDIRVYDGSVETTIANDVVASLATITTASYPWTYVGGSDGSEVYIEFDENGNGITGTNNRAVLIEYIDWLMDYGATDDGLMVVERQYVTPSMVTVVAK